MSQLHDLSEGGALTESEGTDQLHLEHQCAGRVEAASLGPVRVCSLIAIDARSSTTTELEAHDMLTRTRPGVIGMRLTCIPIWAPSAPQVIASGVTRVSSHCERVSDGLAEDSTRRAHWNSQVRDSTPLEKPTNSSNDWHWPNASGRTNADYWQQDSDQQTGGNCVFRVATRWPLDPPESVGSL
jgi:hypothetical protein